MNVVFAFSHHTGIRLGEVAFLLILVAGVWLAVAHAPRLGRSGGSTAGPGVLLAVAGLLLIIASHWGRFG